MDFDANLLDDATTSVQARRAGHLMPPGERASDDSPGSSIGYALGLDGAFIARLAEQVAYLHEEVTTLRARVAALE